MGVPGKVVRELDEARIESLRASARGYKRNARRFLYYQLYRASLPPSYDERLLYESHIRLCAREEDREHWREGYRLIGMDV